MSGLRDLTNQVFGNLTVIKRGENSKWNRPQWICKCSCGNQCLIKGASLRSGKATQCPICKKFSRTTSLDNKILNVKFGHLTPIKIDETKERGAGKPKYWICQCDCGNLVSLTSHQLLGNLQITCGNKCVYHKEAISQRKTEDLTNKNFGNLTVIERDFSKNMNTKTINRTSYWKCLCKCGNEIIASRTSLINGTRQCCNSCLKGKSIGEKNIENLLKKNNIKFQSQVSFSDLIGVNGGYPRFDFVLYNNENKIIRAIEFDGQFHYLNNNIWNSQSVKANDIIKNEYCIKNNIPLVRIPYWERDNITLEMILGGKYLYA